MHKGGVRREDSVIAMMYTTPSSEGDGTIECVCSYCLP